MFKKQPLCAIVSRSVVLLWVGTAVVPRAALADAPAPADSGMRTYCFYDPKVSWHMIYEGRYGPDSYPYNHCASLAWFDGKFYVVWAANKDTHLEPFPNRQIVLSTSEDFVHWTSPIHFVGPGAVNPCHAHPKERQSQPNLVNYMDKELWCTWLYGSVDRNRSGIYLSKLGKGPDAKWVNKRIFHRYQVSGKSYGAWAAQTPFVCRSGRVLVPLMLVRRDPDYEGRTVGYNVCYYTDDGGETWDFSNLISVVYDPTAQWEPLFHEQVNGKLRAFMRNFTPGNVSSTQWLLTCTGTGAKKGGPVVFHPDPTHSVMETVSCRTHVFRLHSRRYCMLNHDLYFDERGYDSRLAVALRFSRTGEDDFIAGPRVSRQNVVSAYPVGIEHNGKLYVVYTMGPGWEPRSIEGAMVDPAPDADKYYIWSRAKDYVRAEYRKIEDKTHAVTCLNPNGVFKSLHRTNPEYKPARPRLTTEDRRKVLFFRGAASAGVDIDPVDFEAGQSLTVLFDAKVTKLQKYGNLVFCSLGDRIPIRLGIPVYRPRRLYAYGYDEWQLVGDFPHDVWHNIRVTFTRDAFSVSIDNGQARDFRNPIVSPNRRLYLGDGYEVDAIRSNWGSEFFVDLGSFRTQVNQ
jgi:hypothetical protein